MVPTFRDQKVVKHCGHLGISFLFTDWTTLQVQSVSLWQPHFDWRVVRTGVFLKAIMEVYGKTIAGLGPNKYSCIVEIARHLVQLLITVEPKGIFWSNFPYLKSTCLTTGVFNNSLLRCTWFKPSSKIFLLTVPRRHFVCGSFMFSVLCLLCLCVSLFIILPCGHQLGKGWPLGSRLWCLTVSLSLPHWYPGSGVVLDCIDSLSLYPYFLYWALVCWSWSVNEIVHNSWTTWYIWINFCILIYFNIIQPLVCKTVTRLRRT